MILNFRRKFSTVGGHLDLNLYMYYLKSDHRAMTVHACTMVLVAFLSILCFFLCVFLNHDLFIVLSMCDLVHDGEN